MEPNGLCQHLGHLPCVIITTNVNVICTPHTVASLEHLEGVFEYNHNITNHAFIKYQASVEKCRLFSQVTGTMDGGSLIAKTKFYIMVRVSSKMLPCYSKDSPFPIRNIIQETFRSKKAFARTANEPGFREKSCEKVLSKHCECAEPLQPTQQGIRYSAQ